jgi:hypothetical protein
LLCFAQKLKARNSEPVVAEARLLGQKMTGANVWKAGRVAIDDDAIVQKPVWGLFGTRFELRWCDIVSWKVKETVLLDRSTGKERIMSRLLCLFHKGGVHVISRSQGDKQFPSIIDRVRQRLPDKENYPVEFDGFEIITHMRLAMLAQDGIGRHENGS